MSERMTDKRLTEIESRGWVNQHHNELIQALKAEREKVEELQKELEGKKRGVGYHDVEEFYK